MRRTVWLPALLVLPLLVHAEDEPPPPKHEVGVNLVPNHDFEKAHPREKDRPLGWEEPDGLTSFWEKHAGRGHVVRLDTDVLQSEHDRRLEEMQLPRSERPKARPKSPTVPPKYDTVGGNKGATLRCDPIAVEPGAAYRITVDVRSDGPLAKIWVKGYGVVPARGAIPERRRKLYDAYKQVRGKTEGWETFTRVVHPTSRPAHLRGSQYPVREIQVQLYAYWPPGEVLFDNVRFEKILEEEKETEKETR